MLTKLDFVHSIIILSRSQQFPTSSSQNQVELVEWATGHFMHWKSFVKWEMQKTFILDQLENDWFKITTTSLRANELRWDIAFIGPIHHNKPNITYLFNKHGYLGQYHPFAISPTCRPCLRNVSRSMMTLSRCWRRTCTPRTTFYEPWQRQMPCMPTYDGSGLRLKPSESGWSIYSSNDTVTSYLKPLFDLNIFIAPQLGNNYTSPHHYVSPKYLWGPFY